MTHSSLYKYFIWSDSQLCLFVQLSSAPRQWQGIKFLLWSPCIKFSLKFISIYEWTEVNQLDNDDVTFIGSIYWTGLNTISNCFGNNLKYTLCGWNYILQVKDGGKGWFSCNKFATFISPFLLEAHYSLNCAN